MVLAKFYVTLDNGSCVFLPGQEIKGSVHVWNDEPKIVNGNVQLILMIVILCQLQKFLP
jgi:hypothetical protein